MITESDTRRRLGIMEDLDISGAPEGKLKGKTFVAKDLMDVTGHITGAGSPEWASRQTSAQRMAWAIQAVLDEGARLIGKSCTDELACSLDGINAHYGTPVNSQLPDRIPGGSSSGSAAAVAARLCDFALGTDTVGSVRVPASYCGLYGFRPTHGAVPLDGVLPLGPSFDTLGWMAGDAGLLALCGSVLLKQPLTICSLESLCILESSFEDSDMAVQETLISVAGQVGKMFNRLSRRRIGPRSLSLWASLFATIRSKEAWRSYGDWIERDQPRLSGAIRARLEEGKSVVDEDEQVARALKSESARFISEFVATNGIVCFPTTWGLPPRVDAEQQVLSANRRNNLEHTIISTISGLPELTVPITVMPDVALGLSFLGQPNADMELLNLGQQLQKAGITCASSPTLKFS